MISHDSTAQSVKAGGKGPSWGYMISGVGLNDRSIVMMVTIIGNEESNAVVVNRYERTHPGNPILCVSFICCVESCIEKYRSFIPKQAPARVLYT